MRRHRGRGIVEGLVGVVEVCIVLRIVMVLQLRIVAVWLLVVGVVGDGLVPGLERCGPVAPVDSLLPSSVPYTVYISYRSPYLVCTVGGIVVAPR